jgi:hypothetical protein
MIKGMAVAASSVNGNQRKGSLVGIYRMVIALTHHGETDEYQLNNASVACLVDAPLSLMKKTQKMLESRRLREELMLRLGLDITNARLFSSIGETGFNYGAYSVYNLQEDTQRWFDMCRPIEIDCALSDEGGDFGVQPIRKKFAPVLVDVLDDQPYSGLFSGHLSGNTEAICIHDFNSASLMMDVAMSQLKLNELLIELKNGNPDHRFVQKKFVVFLMQTYVSDKYMSKFLKSEIDSAVEEIDHPMEKTSWLSVPIGNHRKMSEYDPEQFKIATVNEIAGYYWGSGISNFGTTNHRYFAWPGAEKGSYKSVLKIIRFLLFYGDRKGMLLGMIDTGLRNSLFINPVCDSLLALIGKLECSSYFDSFTVKIKDDDTIHGSLDQYASLGTEEDEISVVSETHGGDEEHVASESDHPRTSAQATLMLRKLAEYGKASFRSKMTKAKLVSDLKSELSSLATRVSSAGKGEFKLYCGVSWPTKIDSAAGSDGTRHEDNVHVFGKGVRVQRHLGSRMENAVEYLADIMKQNPPSA